MVLKPRGDTVQLELELPTVKGRSRGSQAKPFQIGKPEVLEAYKRVKANKGGEGCDAQSLDDFEEALENNLYKLWNRLSSGSYIPPPVLRVEIAKSDGGIRPLGIPTVGDRIAQMVVKRRTEVELERIFHPEMRRTMFYLDEELVRWAKRKYKRLRRKSKAVRWIIGVRRREPNLFVHWKFANGTMVGR